MAAARGCHQEATTGVTSFKVILKVFLKSGLGKNEASLQGSGPQGDGGRQEGKWARGRAPPSKDRLGCLGQGRRVPRDRGVEQVSLGRGLLGWDRETWLHLLPLSLAGVHSRCLRGGLRPPCSPTPEVSLISRGGYDITALSRGWDALRNPWAVQAKAFSARDPRRGRWGHSPRLQPRFLPLRGEQGGPGMKRGERGQPRALSALLLPKPAGAGLRPASPTRPPDVPAALQAVGLGSVPELPDPTLRAGAR